MARAVVLLSGGLDSTTAAALARREGWALYGLTLRYGQVHAAELEAARRVALALGFERHVELDVDLRAFGGSALVGDGAIPKDRIVDEVAIPSTYVPARNTVFLSLALAWAEVLAAERIVIGVNALDYSGYPDCRPEFLRAFEKLASVATAAGTERGERFALHAPLLALTKAGIVRRARELGVDLALTHTCYDPILVRERWLACGRCDACRLRLKGFEEAGVADPLPYAKGSAPYVDDQRA